VSLSDGRQVVADGSWPRLADMPAAERVESYWPSDRDVVFDGSEAIDDVLTENRSTLRSAPSSVDDFDDSGDGDYRCTCSVLRPGRVDPYGWLFVVAATLWRRGRRRGWARRGRRS
jgi:hypothetical protein